MNIEYYFNIIVFFQQKYDNLFKKKGKIRRNINFNIKKHIKYTSDTII